MSEHDPVRKLIHAWLDSELDPAGAEELLSELRADRARLAEVEELEAIAEAAARLPAPALPRDFVARTMARIGGGAERHAPWWLARPLRLRLVHLALAAPARAAHQAVTAVDKFGQGREEGARTVAVQPQPPGSEPIRFSYTADARTVELAGDFNGWRPQRLERGADGTFELVLPLGRGRYEYALRVDGRWQQDPTAVLTVEDGFGGRNSVLEL
jgi:hypothetical protein